MSSVCRSQERPLAVGQQSFKVLRRHLPKISTAFKMIRTCRIGRIGDSVIGSMCRRSWLEHSMREDNLRRSSALVRHCAIRGSRKNRRNSALPGQPQFCFQSPEYVFTIISLSWVCHSLTASRILDHIDTLTFKRLAMDKSATFEKLCQSQCKSWCIYAVPVVPHKPVAEVSKIGNL